MLDGLMLSASQRSSLEKATATFERNVEDLASYLAPRGIGRDAALGARLGKVCEPIPGYERFVGWMSIPYVTPAGVVAIKFRSLEPDPKQKYDAPAGQSARLYNVAALRAPGDTVVLCEGELDALVCHYMVGVPAVGTPGTQMMTHWPRCFADHQNVLIVADNDEKEDGSNPGVKHAKSVQKQIPHSKIVLPPVGMDLGEWVVAEGADAVRRALTVL